MKKAKKQQIKHANKRIQRKRKIISWTHVQFEFSNNTTRIVTEFGPCRPV